MNSLNICLLTAAGMNIAAAAMHIMIIFKGADWYLKFGAGERMAEMARRGHWWPATITAMISIGLLIFAVYALAGAGLISHMPFENIILWLITAIYLLRGLGALLLMPFFHDLRTPFMLKSSVVVILFGVVHLCGLLQMPNGLTLPFTA